MPIYNASLKSIDQAEARRYAGLRKAPDFGEELLAEAAEEALLLASPRGIYEIYDYEAATGRVLAPEPFTLGGRSIRRHLKDAEKVIALAVTVGDEIEEAVTEHFAEGRYAYSVLLDACATAAVEQTADELERAIFPKAKAQGFLLRPRFSPGYGDWPIGEQPQLVAASRAAGLGIHLTEAMMLSPRKSVTALIGLYRPESVKAAPERKGCAACTRKDCPARK